MLRTKRACTEEQEENNPELDTQNANASKDEDDHISMKHLLDESNDNYGAMLKYMQQSGKSGADALQALEAARAMRNF